MKKTNFDIRTFYAFVLLLSAIPVFGAGLVQPIESYYTIKDYDAPHFHLESLSLDQEAFIELVDKVNQKTHDRAFLIEVPNKLYSENVAKLHAAQFFHYFDFPENNSSIWCRTNGSGIPLAASHTFGGRALVYFKKNSEFFFLLIKDKYGHNGYEVPGGCVQPDDKEIVEAFEKGYYKTINLDYRSPEETAISEVLEETGFDLTKYGYGPDGTKKPLTIARVYTKNTRPDRGIHSVNDHCEYLLFEATPNEDSLRKQDREILDLRWVSYTDIINDRIDSPIGIHYTDDNIKTLIQRVVSTDKYKNARNQLVTINKKIQDFLSADDIDIREVKSLIKVQADLEELKTQLEVELKQVRIQRGKKHITYFNPI